MSRRAYIERYGHDEHPDPDVTFDILALGEGLFRIEQEGRIISDALHADEVDEELRDIERDGYIKGDMGYSWTVGVGRDDRETEEEGGTSDQGRDDTPKRRRRTRQEARLSRHSS